MGVERLRAGEWLAAAGGVVLLVSLFLPWYGLLGADVSGFEALSVIDLLLVLLALLAIALAVLQATQDSPAMPVGGRGPHARRSGCSASCSCCSGSIFEPESSALEVEIGAWIALAATVAITAGGWLSLMNEHVRGLPPDIEPELRPTPVA